MSQYGLKTFLIKIKSSELLHIYFIAIKLLLYDSHGLICLFLFEVKWNVTKYSINSHEFWEQNLGCN